MLQKKKLGLIVCADDFGLSPEINSAILRLLRNQRISAVSCLTRGNAWQQGAEQLRDLQDAADVGLHLSYDEIPFNKVVSLAYTRTINKGSVIKEFNSQLQMFVEHMGRPPDYIDGHKHIHQLPVFRSALLEFLENASLDRFYIRNSSASIRDILSRKTSIIKNLSIAMHGRSLKKALRKRNIPTNNDFLGIYDFHRNSNPGRIFEQLLRAVNKTNSILMTHPGDQHRELNGFERVRVEELRYLESVGYKETLDRCGLYLTRFLLTVTG